MSEITKLKIQVGALASVLIVLTAIVWLLYVKVDMLESMIR